MKRLMLIMLLVTSCCAAPARADDAAQRGAEDDVQKIAGTWVITELTIQGVEVKGDFLQNFTVVNDDNGGWVVQQEGVEVSRGASTFDTTKTPKTIDFTSTDKDGKEVKYIGIYELTDDTRRLCYVEASEQRPTEFTSDLNSKTILLMLKRMKTE